MPCFMSDMTNSARRQTNTKNAGFCLGARVEVVQRFLEHEERIIALLTRGVGVTSVLRTGAEILKIAFQVLGDLFEVFFSFGHEPEANYRPGALSTEIA